MKHPLASVCLAIGLVFSVNQLALAQSPTNPKTLDATRVNALAEGIIEKHNNCAVYRAVVGMNQAEALTAVQAIAAAGQRLAAGSMGVVIFEGDPGNMLISLNYVAQAGSNRGNVVAYYTLFSHVHPVVDDYNSACSY